MVEHYSKDDERAAVTSRRTLLRSGAVLSAAALA
jgi:hypothetical protein